MVGADGGRQIHPPTPGLEDVENAPFYELKSKIAFCNGFILKGEMTVDDVIDSLPVFPTLSESIKIAALSFTTDITKLSCCI